MTAGCTGVGPLNPVHDGTRITQLRIPLREVDGRLTNEEDVESVSEYSEELCEVPDDALMSIIFNLEQERETYLEAVAVLHDRLQEAQEHFQQLKDSHLHVTRNLEEEVSEGWREAERWEARYHSLAQVARCLGLNVVALQRQMEAKAGLGENLKATIRSLSLNSDACTVVTKGDLDHEEYGVDIQGSNGAFRVVVPGTVAKAIRQINACLEEYALRKGETPRRSNAVRMTGARRDLDRRYSIFADEATSAFNEEMGNGAFGAEQEPRFNANLPASRVLGHRKGTHIFRSTETVDTLAAQSSCLPRVDARGCRSLTPVGAPCARCGVGKRADDARRFPDSIGTSYCGWLYLHSPRMSGTGQAAKSTPAPRRDISAVMELVFDAVDY
ncbi:centromere F, putative [Babesia caballi]|uniref:Centromere F, putative n=1 Tax=Babesia caballi TaxID=5871 RepID=A0AAV4LLQ8_BABCB|nr:centromere F, putative [Babesia caballi]